MAIADSSNELSFQLEPSIYAGDKIYSGVLWPTTELGVGHEYWRVSSEKSNGISSSTLVTVSRDL